MAEYICREAILDDLEKEIEAGNVALDEDVWVNKGLRIAIRDIKDIKNADVQPVKHGRWKDGEKSQVCTICGGWGLDSFAHCPHCGAKMIKDGDAE